MEQKPKNLIFMFPKECMGHNDSILVKLKHPLTENPSYFVIDKKERKVLEVQNFDEKQRSWFFRGNVLSDGSIKIVTPYNPVFLILPYLLKADKNIPLDHLLEDEKYPDTHLLADIVEDISCVADRIDWVEDSKKEYLEANLSRYKKTWLKRYEIISESLSPASLNVWKYNENSTINWLTSKVDKLAKTLLENREKPSLTSSVTNNEDIHNGSVPFYTNGFKIDGGMGTLYFYPDFTISHTLSHLIHFLSRADVIDKEMYRVLAFGILSDNLPKELSAKLKIHLQLPETSLDDEKENDLGEENKKIKIEENIEKSKPKKTNVVKQTAKEKALAKSAKGSKSITSFFSKK
ncbi:Ribonuclease H2 subunit B [Armadillidium nasatum]|uniref:Ribonuclease H2 subunit B n=1 Tax=Armadillidium nasatum TaxID=96803 RepID=A0A5N5TCT6_9CRUS|nr:Ribonuclease H2 subunit B [Armadillidium nasatum]